MFSFRPSHIPNNIFVVGCGGTGSRLVPMLVQFIRSITREHVPSGWLGTTNIVLIDGDVVEQKNLIRQNFISTDVGKNKAQVLAMRYAKAYGMNVVAYPKFIESTDNYGTVRNKIRTETGLPEINTNDMVIMCVDSANARRIVINAFGAGQHIVGNHTAFIDAGNEDSFGQVRLFHSVIAGYYSAPDKFKEFKTPERMIITPTQLDYIPFDPEFYANLKDNPGLGSCADLDQTLAINSLMATFILSFVQNYYYGKVIDYNQVSLDVVKGTCEYTKNTIAEYRNRSVYLNSREYASTGNHNSYTAVGLFMPVEITHHFNRYFLENNKAIEALGAIPALVKKGECSCSRSCSQETSG